MLPTVSTAVGRGLLEHGDEVLFGVAGNGNVPVIDAFVRGGGRYVKARHESGAVMMADAHARVSGRLGLATVTQGPGLTNAITALVEASISSTSMVLVVGERPTEVPRRSYDIDQTGLLRTLDIPVFRVTAPQATSAQVNAAALQAVTERKPVVLSIPADLLGACGVEAAARPPAAVRRSAVPDLGAAIEVLQGASRPVILAGRGAWLDGAGPALAEIGDRIGALLTTTAVAHGLFAGSEMSIGVTGGFASAAAADLVQRADVVLAVGASLNPFTTRQGSLCNSEATLIQIDHASHPTWDRVDLHIRCGAADAVAALRGALVPNAGWRAEDMAIVRHAQWAEVTYDDRSNVERIDPRTLTRALGDLLPDNRVVVVDAGHFFGWPAMYWASSTPADFVLTGVGFQSVGLGTGAATGAAIARPDATTVLAVGDGGAMMGLADLETLVRHARSALVVVFNDAGYGAEVHQFPDGEMSAMVFEETNLAQVARALGAWAEVVRTVDDLAVVERWRADGAQGTLYLDCRIDREVIADWMRDLVH